MLVLEQSEKKSRKRKAESNLSEDADDRNFARIRPSSPCDDLPVGDGKSKVISMEVSGYSPYKMMKVESPNYTCDLSPNAQPIKISLSHKNLTKRPIIFE